MRFYDSVQHSNEQKSTQFNSTFQPCNIPTLQQKIPQSTNPKNHLQLNQKPLSLQSQIMGYNKRLINLI